MYPFNALNNLCSSAKYYLGHQYNGLKLITVGFIEVKCFGRDAKLNVTFAQTITLKTQ